MGKEGFDRSECSFVGDQLNAEHFSRSFTGNIIAGRSEAAGDDDHITALHRLSHGEVNGLAVRDGGLALHAQAEFKELDTHPRSVGIDGGAQQ